ncbi:hypothetical protein JCM10908_003761 [Rhodotorula pacifica]|uniref:bZIP transcription factor n=1 Tax=Rhodotorula pacifica TaxID=1495444 RepID=UPI00316F1C18
MSELSQSPEQALERAPTRKRGRKRIEEPAVDMTADEHLDAEKKRKLQNRAAQRAFRERKEKHVTELEERVKLQEDQLQEFVLVIRSLLAENQALRRGESPLATEVPASVLNYDVPHNSAGAPSTSSPGLSASPVEHKPVHKPSQQVSKPKLEDATSPKPFATSSAHPPIPVLPPPPLERPASSLDILARASQAPTVIHPSAFPDPVPTITNFDEATFDFDAPFDFSESMPLPPLFTSLAAEGFEMMNGLGRSTGTATPATTSTGNGSLAPQGLEGDADDVCPNEEDEPPLLPGDRIPCDKPECDFTAVSCALPVPWRPPTVADDDKNLWVAQKCWAKLCSHPLFHLCDTDELCQLLRDKTRCSEDGRLVCHKSDVCDIFRSLPKRAKVRQQMLSMA